MLDVSDCNAHILEYGETRALLNNDTLFALESLATNSSLKTLKMNGSNCSSRGWTGFFNTYLHSHVIGHGNEIRYSYEFIHTYKFIRGASS